MDHQYLKERDYLLSIAVFKFNRQFGRDFKYSDFNIKSIPARNFNDLGYELYSYRTGDHLRLRVYYRINLEDTLDDYRVETDGTAEDYGTPVDEVYVAIGTLSRQWIDRGIYRFLPIEEDYSQLDIFLTEDGEPLLLENGERFYLEEALI